MAAKIDPIFYAFLDYLETNIHSKNDLAICKTILIHLNHIEEIDIKELASLSGTSTASVSRLVNRFDVKNYKEFIHELKVGINRFEHAKEMHNDFLKRYGVNGIVDLEKNNALANLQGTVEGISIQQVDELCDMILKAKTVTFVGANHSLEIFFNLHVLLNGLGIPSFLYKQVDRANGHLSLLGKEDLVIFLSIHGRYQVLHGETQLIKIQKNKVQTALITQTKQINTDGFNQVIYFGVDDSRNDGYYSMDVIRKCIERVLLQKY